MSKGLRMTRSRVKALIKKAAKSKGKRAATPLPSKGPNATERMFNLRFLEGKGKFEAETFGITCFGSEYTPDFEFDLLEFGLGYRCFVEVKGEYRSKKDEKLITERSRLAWEIAAEKEPYCVWVWAKKKGMGFECKTRVPFASPSIVKGLVKTREEFLKFILRDRYAPEAREFDK